MQLQPAGLLLAGVGGPLCSLSWCSSTPRPLANLGAMSADNLRTTEDIDRFLEDNFTARILKANNIILQDGRFILLPAAALEIPTAGTPPAVVSAPGEVNAADGATSSSDSRGQASSQASVTTQGPVAEDATKAAGGGGAAGGLNCGAGGGKWLDPGHVRGNSNSSTSR